MSIISSLSAILFAVHFQCISNTPLTEHLALTPEPIQNTIDPLNGSDFENKHVFHPGYAARVYVNQYPSSQIPTMVTVLDENPQQQDWQPDVDSAWIPKKAIGLEVIYTPRIDSETVYRCKSLITKDIKVYFDQEGVPYNLTNDGIDRRFFLDPRYQLTGGNSCIKIKDFNRIASSTQNATNSDALNHNHHRQPVVAWVFPRGGNNNTLFVQQFGPYTPQHLNGNDNFE